MLGIPQKRPSPCIFGTYRLVEVGIISTLKCKEGHFNGAMEKIRVTRGRKRCFSWVAWKVFFDELTLDDERKPAPTKKGWGKGIPDIRNSRCKGNKAGYCSTMVAPDKLYRRWLSLLSLMSLYSLRVIQDPPSSVSYLDLPFSAESFSVWNLWSMHQNMPVFMF